VGPMQAIMQGVITIFFYGMVIAAVWKLFMMAGDLTEMKTILSDIRRNTANPAAAASPVPAAPAAAATPAPVPPMLAGPISLESAEALLREVAEEEHALAQQPKTTV
jgi:hypothetical protein